MTSAPRPLDELVHPSWVPVLTPVQDVLTGLGTMLRGELASGRGYLPVGNRILRAFSLPLPSVRVLVVGQDPYPTPGHAVGLSFSVERGVRPLPRSLQNVLRELHDDTGAALPADGDLSPWTEQGVLLLNRVLTVAPGMPGSHRGRGWEQVTDAAVRALAGRGGPLVAVLWGRDARAVVPLLGDVPTVTSAHPSPLSASRGFFGSKPFTRVDELLTAQGSEPLDWSLG